MPDASFGRAAVEEVTESGTHNILVNNAAVVSPEQLDRHHHTTTPRNVRNKHLLLLLLHSGGTEYMKAGDVIINITSVTAYRGSHLVDSLPPKG